MKKINLNTKRLEILKDAKKHLIFNGWNDNIFKKIVKERKYKEEEMRALFPKGYRSILELYLSNVDQEMTEACKKIDFIRMRTHERVGEIILMRLKIYEKDKNLVKQTFFTLMLPHHTKIATSSLYHTVDQIWYLAGDHSTNFNFYTKRAILAGLYSSTVLYWMNGNHTLEQTKKFINNQLKKVSRIPKATERIRSAIDIVPKIFSFAKNFSISRR